MSGNSLENSCKPDGLVAGLALAAVLAIGFNLSRSDASLGVMDFAASHVITAQAAAPESASPVADVVQRLRPAAPEQVGACALQPTTMPAPVKTSKT